MSKAFDKIAAGFEDAIAFAQGDGARGRIARPVNVKAIRERVRKTQAEFAEAFHLPVGTVRDWEQNRRQPDAPARVLLHLIEADPEMVQQLIARTEG
jgi:putative transcriptional regulator